jgi:hypothetical protein
MSENWKDAQEKEKTIILYEKELIGIDLEEARKKCNEKTIDNRIVSRDGINMPITMDLKFNRLNFTVVKNIITNITRG